MQWDPCKPTANPEDAKGTLAEPLATNSPCKSPGTCHNRRSEADLQDDELALKSSRCLTREELQASAPKIGVPKTGWAMRVAMGFYNGRLSLRLPGKAGKSLPSSTATLAANPETKAPSDTGHLAWAWRPKHHGAPSVAGQLPPPPPLPAWSRASQTHLRWSSTSSPLLQTRTVSAGRLRLRTASVRCYQAMALLAAREGLVGIQKTFYYLSLGGTWAPLGTHCCSPRCTLGRGRWAVPSAPTPVAPDVLRNLMTLSPRRNKKPRV